MARSSDYTGFETRALLWRVEECPVQNVSVCVFVKVAFNTRDSFSVCKVWWGAEGTSYFLLVDKASPQSSRVFWKQICFCRICL